MQGWHGTVLRVNLTDGEITKESLDEELAHKYVGGRGLNAKFLYDELKPGIDPLGPDNKVIFGVGPACGTLVPSNQRWTVTNKSPLSGFISDGNCGSPFGPALKYAGYDELIIEGKSDRPLYLFIDGDDVQLRDAAHLWGKTTTETTRIIEREIGDPDVHVACIGQAGENLVKFASVISQNRAAGRAGGTVMGSKKLKAVVARGYKGVKVANPEMVEKASREVYEMWQSSDYANQLKNRRGYGPIMLFSAYAELGMACTRNYREGTWPEFASTVRDRVIKYYVRPTSCFSCPVACDHLWVVSEGPYAGIAGNDLMAPGLHYTSRIGNGDPELMFMLSYLSDEYGIDVMNMCGVLGYVMECFQEGILTPSDLGGLQMEWGNAKASTELLEMVVHRRGIGDLLAEGATKAASVIGKGSERYVMESKGMSIDSRDPRGSRSWGLGYAVSSRGADHCRHLFPDMPIKGAPVEPEKLKRMFKFGGKELDRFSEKGQGEMMKWYEDEHAFRHCLEVCMFAFSRITPDSARLLADLYNGVTGLDINPSDVVTIGERITNLERAFNVREGLTRKDDSLPDRFLKEPMPEGPAKGQVVKLDTMLDEYYEFRGWDKATGLPTRKKLLELQMDDVADELQRMGKLAT